MPGGVPGGRNRLAALDPTVHGRSLTFTAVHGPPSYDAEGGTGSGHPATSARHLCSATLVLTTPPLPSTKTPHLVDGLPPQALTVRVWALFPGRSVPFQGDLPCQRPISRKVSAFSGGPSMPEACFPEGPGIILGDQPRRDRLFGRSWGCWQGRWCYPHVFCRGYCQKRRFLRVPSFVFPRVESLGPPADACQGRWCWWGVAGWGGTGDPRLPSAHGPSLRRHPLAGGGMSPRAAPPGNSSDTVICA